MKKVSEEINEKEVNPEVLVTEKVKVKKGVFPVRYENQRYYPGEELNIEPGHFNEDVFEKVD